MLGWIQVPVRVRFFPVFLCFCVLAAACGRDATGPGASVAARPHVVLVTIDTWRADRLNATVTPALHALAGRGVRFTNARATAPLTLPSHVSMLTGVIPPVHGVRENGTYRYEGAPPTAARRLKEAGYRTAAFIGAYVLDRRFGLADGFDHYDDQIARDPDASQRLEAERPGNEVVDRALAWLGTQSAPDPFFLWLHLYDPHAPHAESYDADVRFADTQVGRLLAGLNAAGLQDRLALIVTGDHGESLGEHGERTHGMLAYDAALKVPLIVVAPGTPPATRDDAVSLIDVAPTLLARAGLEAPAGDARDLLAAPQPAREVYAETEYPRVAGWSPVYALAQDHWKLIVSRGAELYDLSADPAETQNLAGTRAAIIAAMSARLETLRKPAQARASRAASPEVAERLRSLGYVGGASATATAPGSGPSPADEIAAWVEFESILSSSGDSRDDARRVLPRLEALSDAYPAAPVFQSMYARTLARTGASRAALAVYGRAVERWPGDPSLLHELAVAARDAGIADEAMRAEQAAIALDPAMAAAHDGIGLLHSDAGRHAEAAAAFARATTHDPTNASYWVNLGNAHRAAGDAARAAEAYRAATTLDPASVDAANGLGVLLVQQGRAADAVPLFERALQTAPEFVEARLNLGIAYQEAGKRDDAARAYREVLSRARPGSPERRAAADLLRNLGR